MKHVEHLWLLNTYTWNAGLLLTSETVILNQNMKDLFENVNMEDILFFEGNTIIP